MKNLSKQETLVRLDKIEAEQKELRKFIESSGKKGLITDRVKTVKDACEELGKNYDDFMKLCSLVPKEAGTMKVKMFIEALCEGWKPNYDDSNEAKYYPWFKKTNTGFVFFLGVYTDYCDSCVGSSLVLPTPELVKHAVACILPEYNEHLTN